MIKVKVEKFGFVHYHAECRQCDFNASILTEETRTQKEVVRAVRKHVIQTGHDVSIEGGFSTKYSRVDE